MFNPFTWLRTAARNALLGGVADALGELHAAAGEDKVVSLADLQVKLQLAAPAATPPAEEPEEEATPAKRKR